MSRSLSRRSALQVMGAGLLLPMWAQQQTMLTRTIPSSGEKLPAVGLGTWRQFDVGSSASERQPLMQVLKNMHAKGGMTIDSSPMYARSEQVVGDLANDVGLADKYFYATKVWTSGREEGIEQMESSMRKMRRSQMDLLQIHNLLDWQTHIVTLRKWKEEKKVRYIGLTHYVDSMHEDLEKIIRAEKPDFVQFNYSIRGRNAEKRLLNAAKDNGVAVILNQPFDGGSLFDNVRGKALPSFAAEYGIKTWAQYFLKYILSHDAVTCAIPGTSDPLHALQNMEAMFGLLPDNKTRKKMVEYLA
ncbi:MAG: aldo/keto reductase [Chitinophagaceae bacterium]|nr:MAG: aldo/keto reductase [Chitinophagaceae bacterium]